MSAHVYILRCHDDSYYVGSTRTSVEARVAEHNHGFRPGYTFNRRPVALVFSQECDRITDAIAAERRLKGWSRAKKEAVIRGEFDLLPMLARRRSKGVRECLSAPFETAAPQPPQDEDVY